MIITNYNPQIATFTPQRDFLTVKNYRFHYNLLYYKSLRNLTLYNKTAMMVAMTLIVLIVAKTQFFSSPLPSHLF